MLEQRWGISDDYWGVAGKAKIFLGTSVASAEVEDTTVLRGARLTGPKTPQSVEFRKALPESPQYPKGFNVHCIAGIWVERLGP